MKKLALCVGINKYGHGNDLSECVPDAKGWSVAAVDTARTLTGQSFEVVTLVDQQATVKAVMAELARMNSVAKKGDSLLFTFSGHGTQVPDENGDELDGMDEAICLLGDKGDIELVYDDQLWKLYRSKPSGVKWVMISDSCHSGTVARKIGAPILANNDPAQRRRHLPWQLLMDIYGEIVFSRGETIDRSAPRLMAEEGWAEKDAAGARVPWPVLLSSGCQDNEYSYDAPKLGHGAYTYHALEALKQMKKGSTWNEFFLEIRKHLPSREYPQTPRLMGSYLSTPVLG